MSDLKDFDEKQQNSFLRERIVYRQAETRWGQKLALAGAAGLVFGLTALGVIFGAMALKNRVEPATTTAEIIIVDRDTTEATPTEATTEAPETTPTETESASTEQIGISWERMEELITNLTEQEVKEQLASPDMLASMYTALLNAGQEAAGPVVSVFYVAETTDIFGLPVQTEESVPGILWHRGENEALYVLCPGTGPLQADRVYVALSDGSSADALVCGTDERLGICVLQIPAENSKTLGEERLVELGNSYTLQGNNVLYAIGDFFGGAQDVVPAALVRQDDLENQVDGYYRKLILDFGHESDTSGFLLSMDGKLMGLILPEREGSGFVNLGISDIKGVLELLANGQPIPYLGICGETVTDAMKETYGLPTGIYINEVEEDSPAYEAGIKPGDVLNMVGAYTITNIRGLRNVVENLSVEDPVIITVFRSTGESYQELQFQIQPGTR